MGYFQWGIFNSYVELPEGNWLIIIEGSLEVKLPTMKSRDGKSQREEKSRREKIREEKESE